MTGLAALACGVGMTWAYMHFSSSGGVDRAKADDDSKRSGKGEKSSSKVASDPQSTKGDDASSGLAATSVDGGDPSGQVRNLAARFDMMRQRVDAMSMPRDTNSPDLTALRVRLDEFSRSIDEMKELPSRLREMQARQDRLEAEMRGRQDRPVDGPGQAHPPPSPAVSVPSKPAVEPPAAPPAAAKPGHVDDSLAEGASLIKKGNYSGAGQVFAQLRKSNPQDARVWYFSALADGLSTGRWDGGARSYVIQGAERERAGLPATSLIDTAFSDLSPASVKDWLTAYRNQLLKR